MYPCRRALLFVLLVLTAIAVAGRCVTFAEEPSRPPWEQLLWWLPEDTETVIVAQGGVEIPKREQVDALAVEEALLFLPAGPLPRTGLEGHRLVCAVEGSRRFTSPSGLGMMPYEGCHILQFEPASEDAVRKAFGVFQEKAAKRIELAGEQVVVLTAKLEDDVWSYFICQPRPGILICATDQAFLEATLKRIGRKPEKRALPADLPEWKHVNVKARVWGVRHYRKETAMNDPSSPLGPWPRAATVVDSAAIGFVFEYSPGPDNVARVRYLSGSKDALRIATEGWNDVSAEFRQVEPGVAEIVTSLSNEQTVELFVFVLMAYLGHGIFL